MYLATYIDIGVDIKRNNPTRKRHPVYECFAPNSNPTCTHIYMQVACLVNSELTTPVQIQQKNDVE